LLAREEPDNIQCTFRARRRPSGGTAADGGR
jgi:hypothetical protein